MTAPDRIWCHPTERQPVPAKDRRNAKWVRGRWKDHDSKASGDVEYIRADLVEAAEQRGYASAMEAERKLHEDRIAALTEQLAAARGDAEEAEAYAGWLEAKLAKAVEEAFFEGFCEGRDGDWVWGDPTPAWEKSDSFAELKGDSK